MGKKHIRRRFVPVFPQHKRVNLTPTRRAPTRLRMLRGWAQYYFDRKNFLVANELSYYRRVQQLGFRHTWYKHGSPSPSYYKRSAFGDYSIKRPKVRIATRRHERPVEGLRVSSTVAQHSSPSSYGYQFARPLSQRITAQSERLYSDLFFTQRSKVYPQKEFLQDLKLHLRQRFPGQKTEELVRYAVWLTMSEFHLVKGRSRKRKPVPVVTYPQNRVTLAVHRILSRLTNLRVPLGERIALEISAVIHGQGAYLDMLRDTKQVRKSRKGV